ncbi:tetratricopeptide repeat protein [Bremerella alba]|uniref:Tetratricopeptide repeat protein n=1 Tax=Bremerella alba TaxID=980252 RepID=A0A7V9A7M6_9BACT|nr:tetratricopeptide repeat protein [Bremerella alba]MBA2115580.1 hypothetical protein [Bremerella alba]
MRITFTILVTVVLVELVAAGIYLQQEAAITIPLLPREHLTDPSIIPQLEVLAAAAESGSVDQWYRLGEGLLGKGFYSHAELAFRQSLREDPSHLKSQFGFAFCLDRTGRMEESNVAYGKVVQGATLTSEDQAMQVYALYAMGRNAIRMEDAEQAHRLFQQNSGYPAADYQLAKLWVRSGDTEKALPLIRKNLANIPFSLGFHFLDQRAQDALGDRRAAFMAKSMVDRSAYLVSLNFNTDYVAPLNAQTGINSRVTDLTVAREDEDWDRVEVIGNEVFSLIGDSSVFAAKPFVDAMLQASLHKQHPQEVLDLVAKLKSEGRIDAITLEAAGDAYLLLNDPTQAIAYWQRALRLNPSISLHEKLADHGNVGERFHRSQVALKQGLEHYRRNRLRSAIPKFQQAIDINPDSAVAWYYLGEMYFHLDQLDEAAKAYQKCSELDPQRGKAFDKIDYLRQRE